MRRGTWPLLPVTVDLDVLAGLDDAELIATLEQLVSHQKYNRLDFFEPYDAQKEFFTLGATKQERMLFAGNQLGKSYAGAAEVAYHLTGLYPEWWTGRRWTRAVNGWAAGESTQSNRDIGQTLLFGDAGVEELFGSGLVPRHLIVDKTLARGAVADAYDTVQVRHVSGGVSVLQFKSYEQGRKKFQGKTLDFVWWDEEPSMDVYIEGNARWSATGGMSFMTFTPLQGMSEVVCRFLQPDMSEDADLVAMRGHLVMGIKDAKHMTPEMQRALLAKYPRHEWDARMNGLPLLGSGRVFVFDEKAILYPRSLNIPVQWSKLGGIDFGISHPFAYLGSAWDRDNDILYFTQEYRASSETPLLHCTAIRALGGGDVPVAWPHDGAKREAGSGARLADNYRLKDDRPYGLRLLPTHAHFPRGGFSTEAAVLELQQRFEKGAGPGGVRICEDLTAFLSELRMYHRKDGLLVKQNDDLISAAQKIIMAKRFGRAMPTGNRPLAQPGAMRENRRTQGPAINPFNGRPVYAA